MERKVPCPSPPAPIRSHLALLAIFRDKFPELSQGAGSGIDQIHFPPRSRGSVPIGQRQTRDGMQADSVIRRRRVKAARLLFWRPRCVLEFMLGLPAGQSAAGTAAVRKMKHFVLTCPPGEIRMHAGHACDDQHKQRAQACPLCVLPSTS